MKFALKSLVIASAFIMAGAAQADTVTGTLTGSSSISAFGWTVSGLTGGGALSFSSQLITALNAGGIEVSAIAPATVAETLNKKFQYVTLSANAPVTSLTGTFDSNTQVLTVNSVGTKGGALLTATADGLTNTGGSLSITSIGVDLASKTILADITGGNGVGYKEQIAMWKYDSLTGDTTFAAKVGTISSTNNVTGLTITDSAKALFIQSLGLQAAGVTAMDSIANYGSLVSTISATVTSNVPEPSTYVLAALGLVGIVAAKRARRA
jgi:PEP-CTERM motif